MYDAFDDTASAIHNHEISDINTLPSKIEDYDNHLDDFNNPHNVNLGQLGLSDLHIWTLRTKGKVYIRYNKHLNLVFLSIAQSLWFGDTHWNTRFSISEYDILRTFSPVKATPLKVVAPTGMTTEIEGYMTSDGDILMKSNETGTHEFILTGFYPANIHSNENI